MRALAAVEAGDGRRGSCGEVAVEMELKGLVWVGVMRG